MLELWQGEGTTIIIIILGASLQKKKRALGIAWESGEVDCELDGQQTRLFLGRAEGDLNMKTLHL